MVMVLVSPAASINKGAVRTCGISLMESAAAVFWARVWQKIVDGKLDITRTAEIVRANRGKESLFIAYPP
jgi:hypothetical protein